MKAMYCEIERGRGRANVNIYTEVEYSAELERRRMAEKRRAQCVAKQRRRAHVQEVVGGIVGMFGFLLLMCIDGVETLWGMALLGAVGLGLMVLGGWMGHAFYGQADKAEWLRRMRERGEIE